MMPTESQVSFSDICLSSVGCFFFPAPASRLFQTRPDLSLLLMAFSLSLCLLLTKVKIQAAAYTLFLFKNVSDSASLLSRFLTVLITSHNPSIPHTACVRSLELLLIPAAVLIITAVIGTRLRQAVYYTRFLPVWSKNCFSIPAFFFLMYYMDMGLIYMPELRLMIITTMFSSLPFSG